MTVATRSARHAAPPTPRSRGPWPMRLAILAAAVGAAVLADGQLLIVAALGAALIGVLVAGRPETAALAAVGLIYSNATVLAVREHGAPGAVALLVPVLLIVTVGHHVLVEHLPVLLPRSALWMVALLIAQSVGALASRDPQVSVAAVQTLLLEGVVLFVLITNAIRGWRAVRAAAIVLVVAAGLLGTLSLAQELSGSDSQDFGGFATMSNAVINKNSDGGGSARHAGPIGEQNRWAQTLAIMVPIALALATTDKSRGVRITCRVAGIGIVVGLVLTYSRGAVVGLVLTALVAVVLRWVRLSTTVGIGAAAIFLLASFAPAFTDRASTVVTVRSSLSSRTSSSSTAQDGSFSNRSTEAAAATSVFLAHPVIGVGVGLFPSYFQDEARAQGADRIVGVDREAHNLYLGLLAETGLVGLATFLGFTGSLLAPLARVRRRHLATDRDIAALATGFALAVVTYLTTGLFLHFAYIRYFWLLAALAAAMGMVTGAGRPDPTPTVRGRGHRSKTWEAP